MKSIKKISLNEKGVIFIDKDYKFPYNCYHKAENINFLIQLLIDDGILIVNDYSYTSADILSFIFDICKTWNLNWVDYVSNFNKRLKKEIQIKIEAAESWKKYLEKNHKDISIINDELKDLYIYKQIINNDLN